MANITGLETWSTTAASNQPDGTDSATIKDDLQTIQAEVRKHLGSPSSDIASAATTDLSTATGNVVNVTGTTTITALGTLSAGLWKIVKFTGALTLTHNATSLILPGAANITTADGDVMLAYSLGSGNWKVAFYERANGNPVSLASPPAIGGTTPAAGAFTTLSASSTVSGAGFSTYLASPPAIGGTTPAAGTFTSLTSTGNTILGDATGDTVTVNGSTVTLAGASTRITGDMSNATIANRVAIQTSTVNGSTGVNVIPNGTGTVAGIAVATSGGLTNYSYLESAIDGTYADISSGKAGTGSYLPMRFIVGGSERIRIDTSGSVGVGFNNIGSYGKLGVGGTGYQASFVFSTDASGAVGLLAANSSAEVRVGSATNHPVLLYVNGAERVRIDASGNFGIGLTPTARNNTRLQIVDGLGFPATQVASSDANTLDDYEEGTWQPRVDGSSTQGAGTYTDQSGVYTKVGRKVTCYCQLGWSAHTGTGNMLVANLPFTPLGYYVAVTAVSNGLTLSANSYLSPRIDGSTTTITMYQTVTGSSSLANVPMDSSVSHISLNFTYFI